MHTEIEILRIDWNSFATTYWGHSFQLITDHAPESSPCSVTVQASMVSAVCGGWHTIQALCSLLSLSVCRSKHSFLQWCCPKYWRSRARLHALVWLSQEANWMTMARDVEQHCREWVYHMPRNQATGTTTSSSHKPWQMVVVGVLEVMESSRNNRYLLEVRDYLAKWADAVPMQDQMSNRITEELAKVSVTYDQAEITWSHDCHMT